MLSFKDIFCCRTCGHWFLYEGAGPGGDCRWCYWGGVPIERDAATPEEVIAEMMGEELEALSSNTFVLQTKV